MKCINALESFTMSLNFNVTTATDKVATTIANLTQSTVTAAICTLDAPRQKSIAVLL